MAAEVSKNVVWQRCAGFLMIVGPGSAASFYMSMAGFYFYNFKSPVFFIFMMMCLYIPYPLVPLFQERFDRKFDELVSTKWGYFLRVIVMQLVLALAVLSWMYAPQSPRLVLLVGIILGTMASIVISSSFQMASALDPHLLIYAQLGQQVGGLLPVLVFACLRFDSDSSLREFRLVLATVVAVCVCVAAFLSYIHFCTELFEKAYRNLSYDDDVAEGDDPKRLLSSAGSGPLDPEDARDGVPAWVWRWIAGVGLMTGVGSCVFSLMPLCGCPFLTTIFALWKLGMDFTGRIVAMPLSGVFSAKGQQPMHAAFSAATVIHTVLGIMLMGLFKLRTRQDFERYFNLFLVIWSTFNVLRNFSSSVSDVTTGLHVRVQDRGAVARTSLLVVTTSGLSGVFVALAVAAIKGDLKLPDWGRAIT